MVNAKEDGTNSNTNKHKLGEKPIEATSEENEREKMEAEARKKFTQHKVLSFKWLLADTKILLEKFGSILKFFV